MNGKEEFQRINEQKVSAMKIPFQQRSRVEKLEVLSARTKSQLTSFPLISAHRTRNNGRR